MHVPLPPSRPPRPLERGAALLGVGMPPRIQDAAARVSASDHRYATNEFCLGIAAEHRIGDTHMPVGVEDRDASVAAAFSWPPRLPLLKASGFNSSYGRGGHSRFES